MALKIIAFLLAVGTIGSIELDRIGMVEAAIQLLLAVALFIIAEQKNRIEDLKKKLYY